MWCCHMAFLSLKTVLLRGRSPAHAAISPCETSARAAPRHRPRRHAEILRHRVTAEIEAAGRVAPGRRSLPASWSGIEFNYSCVLGFRVASSGLNNPFFWISGATGGAAGERGFETDQTVSAELPVFGCKSITGWSDGGRRENREPACECETARMNVHVYLFSKTSVPVGVFPRSLSEPIKRESTTIKHGLAALCCVLKA